MKVHCSSRGGISITLTVGDVELFRAWRRPGAVPGLTDCRCEFDQSGSLVDWSAAPVGADEDDPAGFQALAAEAYGRALTLCDKRARGLPAALRASRRRARRGGRSLAGAALAGTLPRREWQFSPYAIDHIVGNYSVGADFTEIEADLRARMDRAKPPWPPRQRSAAIAYARRAHARNRKQYGRVMRGR